jgi:hypothetical protein
VIREASDKKLNKKSSYVVAALDILTI